MFETTDIPGVLIFTPRVHSDPRGFFLESYNRGLWLEQGIDTVYVQDNHSRSCRRTLRGLHFQLPPAAQIKLVRAVRGVVWDVAVDIRKGSPTFGRSVGVELSAENYKQIYIPEGMAHGFCVLSDDAELLYKTSHAYSPSHDRALAWNDPELAVPWPLTDPLLSERDRKASSFAEYVAGMPFVYTEQI
jgi:dTDP-4-dehydrorhamnose 3,5-epimerase